MSDRSDRLWGDVGNIILAIIVGIYLFKMFANTFR